MSATRRWLNDALAWVGGQLGAALHARDARRQIHFPFASQALSLVPFSIGWKLRRAIYARALTGGVGASTVLHFGVIFDDVDCTVGDDVWISAGCYIEKAVIEDHVLIGPHAVVLAGNRHHLFDRTDIPIKSQGNPPRVAIRIGRGAWIGANATVMSDVGHDAIVGAGAVVTRPVPPYAIVAGSPARVLRMRTSGTPVRAPRAEDGTGAMLDDE